MNVEQGSFAKSTTGSQTLSLEGTFTPTFFLFDIGPRTSTTETLVTRSSGSYDVNLDRKKAYSIFDDGTMRRTVETTSYCITHYKNNSGTFTKIISGNVTAVGAGQFTVNFDTVDSAYSIRFVAMG